MAVSWSDPNPSNATAAALGNAAHIDPVNIGSLVSSIMRFRQEQAQAQQQQMNAMLSGIAKGAQGFEQNAQQGRADDAANAAMYGIQNPNDPYGGFSDPNRVPDYGGTSSLRALESAKTIMAGDTPEAKALEAAKLNLVNAQGHNAWTYPTGSDGTDDLQDFRRQQIINETDMSRARKLLEESLGVTGKDADAALASLSGYKPGQGAFPAIGDHPIINDASEGDYKDRALAAVKAYQDAMSQIRSRPSGFGGHNTTYTPGQGNLSMEGGRETATGAPMHYVEDALAGNGPVTLAVNPLDKSILGTHGMLTLADGTQIPAEPTDTGPGVRRGNFDVASKNPALAYSTPESLAGARYLPSGSAVPVPQSEPTPAPGAAASQGGELSNATRAIGEQLKNMKLTTGEPTPGATPPAQPTPSGPPPAAIEYLRSNPQTAAAFEAKYGQGSAKQFLSF